MTVERQTDAAARCGVAVMAKASIPGRAKTRLVPPLDPSEAAALNTVFLKDVFANVRAAACHASIASYAAGGPAGSEDFFRAVLPPEARYFECWVGNFGECLRHATWELFDRGLAGAVVLNADSPTLPTELLVRTADLLAAPGDRAVLGPCDDGGYYLLGLKRKHERMFQDIDWSTGRVAVQTLARAEELGLPINLLPTWYDVDDAATLRRLHGELFENQTAAPGDLRRSDAVHTAELMRALLAGSDLASRLGIPDPTSAPTDDEQGADVPHSEVSVDG